MSQRNIAWVTFICNLLHNNGTYLTPILMPLICIHRSAASFALARAVEGDGDGEDTSGMVTAADLKLALKEVRPALGTQDEVLKLRYPFGISECSSSMNRVMRDLARYTAPVISSTPRLHSLLLVGAGGSIASGGAGVTGKGLMCFHYDI